MKIASFLFGILAGIAFTLFGVLVAIIADGADATVELHNGSPGEIKHAEISLADHVIWRGDIPAGGSIRASGETDKAGEVRIHYEANGAPVEHSIGQVDEGFSGEIHLVEARDANVQSTTCPKPLRYILQGIGERNADGSITIEIGDKKRRDRD